LPSGFILIPVWIFSGVINVELTISEVASQLGDIPIFLGGVFLSADNVVASDIVLLLLSAQQVLVFCIVVQVEGLGVLLFVVVDLDDELAEGVF
jgi:hypothetical protein